MLKEFRSFVLRGNVVDLAVGVAIGAAFGAIVTAFGSGIISPTTALFGDAGLRDLSFSVGTKVVEGARVPNEFAYGRVLDAMVQFLLTAAVVFFFVVKPVNHLIDRFRPSEPVEETTRECPWCTSSISRRAKRCRFCTAEVEPAAG